VQDHRGGELLEVEGFLVSSPVVIAAWEPVVERLRGARGIVWNAFFEHAGEGGLRYGQTNPDRSRI